MLPSGHDLSGERASLFYAFLFAPLAISGAGTALFHADLRPRSGRGVLVDSSQVFLFIFEMYWVPNVSFVSFLGFTWQDVVGFFASGAAALCLTLLALERMATHALASGRQSDPVTSPPLPHGVAPLADEET